VDRPVTPNRYFTDDSQLSVTSQNAQIQIPKLDVADSNPGVPLRATRRPERSPRGP
jgi:hypothetical protein